MFGFSTCDTCGQITRNSKLITKCDVHVYRGLFEVKSFYGTRKLCVNCRVGENNRLVVTAPISIKYKGPILPGMQEIVLRGMTKKELKDEIKRRENSVIETSGHNVYLDPHYSYPKFDNACLKE